MRTKIKFNFGWKFIKGDIDRGEEINLDDSKWRDVTLPHDWSIEGPISKLNTFSMSYKVENPQYIKFYQGFFPVGIGWYRKRFRLPGNYKGKKVFVEFEGVYRNSDVWMNGRFLGNHKSGYTPIIYDITDYLNFGKENIIALRVDAREKEEWWYQGCGIYRNVWLIITDNLYIEHFGIFVTTSQIKKDSAVVNIRTEVRNENAKAIDCTLITKILDKENKIVGQAKSFKNISQYGRMKFENDIKIKKPELWSPENPYLYKAVSMVKIGEKEVDTRETPFGIRTFYFDANKGFFLNGKNLKLRGMCGHQDCIPLGSALPERVIFETMKLLKECGCNFYRSSHNPPYPALLDACDKLGILVWDENRHLDDSKEGVEDLISMIRRDRNHPCVILWSMENEEYREGTIEGTKILKNLVQITRREDSTRPTTFASCRDVNPHGYADAVDVVSYNYQIDRADDDHKKYPKRIIGLISEYSAAQAIQSAYRDNRDKSAESTEESLPGRVLGTMYELCKGDEICWTAIEERAYLAGGCRWNAFDYLGETNRWPMIGNLFGILDLCHLPKDNYYYYQSIWTERPMVYIIPSHWNFKEGEMIDVWIYTNCDSVELFLNGKSLGEKGRRKAKFYGPCGNGTYGKLWMSPFHDEPVSDAHISFKVEFKPGVLKAIGKKGGKVICGKEIHTAGNASKIVLTSLWDDILSDGQDVCFVKAEVVDQNGTLVPDADNLITFQVKGEGNLIGVGNSDVFSHESFRGNQRKCFNGFCIAAIQSTTKEGEISIIAQSSGLKSGEIIFLSKKLQEI